eukprot:309020_1
MSNSVRLSNLDDFITPSQKCVNPLFSDKKRGWGYENSSASAGGGLVLELEPDEPFRGATAEPEMQQQQQRRRPDLIKSTTKQTATITLNDCLACSGCITSAETVLIQEQSIDRFRAALASSELYDVVIVSISPQSRAALSDIYSFSPADMQFMLTAFLVGIGVHKVVDAAIGEDVAIIESRAELLARVKPTLRKQQTFQQEQKGSSWNRPPTSVAVSSTTQIDHETRKLVPVEPLICQSIPMLVSACPGWVCYAEKVEKQSCI